MEVDLQTLKLLDYYPKSFKDSYLRYHEETEFHSPKMVQCFEKKNDCNLCNIKLQFIDVTNLTLTDFKLITIDLSKSKWFETLCEFAQVQDVFTSNGTTIKNFTRTDFIKIGGKVYAHSSVNMSNWKTPEVFNDHKGKPFKMWWQDFIKALETNTLADIVDNIKTNMVDYLNNCGFETNFKREVINYLDRESPYKVYGCNSFEQFTEHFLISHSITKQQLIIFLVEKICLPLKFMMISNKTTFRNYVKNMNELHLNSREPIQITKSELKSFYFTIVSSIFSKISDTKCLKEVEEPVFDTLHKYHKSLSLPMKNLHKHESDNEFHDPIHKEIEKIKVPHYFHMVMNNEKPLIHNSDFRDVIENQPLTLSHDQDKTNLLQKFQSVYNLSKIQSGLKCNCKKHIFVFRKDGKGLDFSFGKDIIHSDLKISKNERGKHFIETTSDHYPLIDPFACEIINKEGIAKKFKEEYIERDNLHLLYHE